VVTSRELVTHLVSSGLRMSAAQRRAYKIADAVDHGSGRPAIDRGQ
jgi:hypothetical protein